MHAAPRRTTPHHAAPRRTSKHAQCPLEFGPAPFATGALIILSAAVAVQLRATLGETGWLRRADLNSYFEDRLVGLAVSRDPRPVHLLYLNPYDHYDGSAGVHVERRTLGRYSRKEVAAPDPDRHPGGGHGGHSPEPGPEPEPGPDPDRWRPPGTYDKHVRAASGQRPALFELEGPGGLLISHHVRGAAAFAAAVAAQQPAVQRAAALRLDCRPFNASIEGASVSAFPAPLHAWRSCTRAVCRRGLAWPAHRRALQRRPPP